MPCCYCPKALEDLLPHRGPNLMPDTVEMSDDGKTTRSVTKVPAGDCRGREVFGRQDASGAPVWNEPFLGELMALTGIPLLSAKLAAQGQVAVFSMISKLVFHRTVPLHGEIIGNAILTRERGGFSSFGTSATIDGQPILEAEVMSGSASMDSISSIPAQPFATPPAFISGNEALAFKAPMMRFADGLVAIDAAAKSAIAAYTYPVDHPFVPGHFPGAPLMMGVTQWSAAADAAWLAAKALGLGPVVTAQARVYRPSGAEILDVRDLVLDGTDGVPRLVSTKRLAFREPVRPTDGLLIEVTLS